MDPSDRVLILVGRKRLLPGYFWAGFYANKGLKGGKDWNPL